MTQERIQIINKQIESGFENEFERLSKDIEKRDEKTLCEEYQKIVDNLKNNPIDEKELAEIIEKTDRGELSKFEIALFVLGSERFDAANDLEQIALLIKEVIFKVTDFRDKNGVLKTTKNLETYQPMTPRKRMDYEKLVKSIVSNKDAGLEDYDKAREFLAEATNTNTELSEWETKLRIEIVNQEFSDFRMTVLGKK